MHSVKRKVSSVQSNLVIWNSSSPYHSWQVSWLTVQRPPPPSRLLSGLTGSVLLLTVTRSHRSFTCFPILRSLLRHQLFLIQFSVKSVTPIITPLSEYGNQGFSFFCRQPGIFFCRIDKRPGYARIKNRIECTEVPADAAGE